MSADREAGWPRIVAFGDSALLVHLGERIDPGVNAAVRQLAMRLRAERDGGRPWAAPVAAYASVLAPYDVLRWSHREAMSALAALVGAKDLTGPDTVTGPVLEIAVRYGGNDGPDLDEVADRVGLSAAQVVELHASATYRAYVLGFAPGFAYLATLPSALRLPRRATPRPRVPAGSVAIAGQQTAVYPMSTPGGWHLIGRTEARIWDPLRQPPALIEAGRDVRFVPVRG